MYEQDDAYLLEEISRLKGEVNELQRVLEERNIQVKRLEINLDYTDSNRKELLSRISVSLSSLKKQLEEIEKKIEQILTKQSETIQEDMSVNISEIQLGLDEVLEELRERTVEIEKAVTAYEKKVGKIGQAFLKIEEQIENKVEEKVVRAAEKRMRNFSIIGIVKLLISLFAIAAVFYILFFILR